MNKHVYDHIEETVYSEKLANGLTVFLHPKKAMSKTYAIFSTDYGSIDQSFVPLGETEEISVPMGVAHFLEHKLFEKEDHDVFADFGKQGASPNAFTSFTETAYLFSCTNNVKQNVETLIDFVQEPYFSEASVEKEKGIIGQEIKMYDDDPDWQSLMGTIKSLFKEHPVKYDIAGTIDSIKDITKDDLYTCYHTFYHPENMTFFLTGNLDPDEMMCFIKENQSMKHFESMHELKTNFPNEQEEVNMAEHKIIMPVSVPRCTIGIKEYANVLNKEKFKEYHILQDIALDYFFSKGGPFYEELYEEGLIDDSFSYSAILEKNFGFSMISSNTNKPEAFAEKVKKLLLNTADTVIDNDTFQTMKRKKVGQLLRSMNSLESTAGQYINYHVLGIDYFDIIPHTQSLTVKNMNDFLKSWIQKKKIAVCKVVPE